MFFQLLECIFLEINLCFLQAAHETCRKFLHQDNGERLIMVTDPPFGGLVEALASSFKKLMAMWKETEKEGAYYSQIGGFSRNITVRKSTYLKICDSCYSGGCGHIHVIISKDELPCI